MRIKRKYLIIFILGTIVSCIDKQEVQKKGQETLSPFPYLLNSQKVKRFTIEDNDPTWLSTAFYEFNYIGKLSDTVSLENGIKFPLYNPEGNRQIKNDHQKYIDWGENLQRKNWTNAKVEIQTGSALIANSLPVLLRNNSRDSIAIGYGTQMPLVMEALNDKNEWRPIQEKFIYFCGLGIGTIILPPGEIAITLAPVFKGNQKTKLRLVLGNNKSKPFSGYINKRQFESKFEGGDYKEEYKKENPNYKDS